MAKQSEVQPGQRWTVRWHDGSIVEVQVLAATRFPVSSRGRIVGSKTRYACRNLRSGRRVVIKSAAKFRERVSV